MSHNAGQSTDRFLLSMHSLSKYTNQKATAAQGTEGEIKGMSCSLDLDHCIYYYSHFSCAQRKKERNQRPEQMVSYKIAPKNALESLCRVETYFSKADTFHHKAMTPAK